MAATSTAATPLPHAVVSTDDTATSTTKVHDMVWLPDTAATHHYPRCDIAYLSPSYDY